MTRFKAHIQAATLVLALAWSPVASATGKALTLSLHPLYLLVGMAEFTYEYRIHNSVSGMNRSLYVALGAGLGGPLDIGVTVKSTVGYRVYPTGSFDSGLTLSGDLTVIAPLFMARSFLGGKRTTRFGMVLDGGIGIGIITADGLVLLWPCLKANIGMGF